MAINTSKTGKLGFGEFQNINTYNKAFILNVIIAIKDKRHIPKCMTRVAFKKVDKPTPTAKPANIKGNSSIRPYWFSKITCEALRYTIKAPEINPDIMVKPRVILCFINSLKPSINKCLLNFTWCSGFSVSGCFFQNQIQTKKAMSNCT